MPGTSLHKITAEVKSAKGLWYMCHTKKKKLNGLDYNNLISKVCSQFTVHNRLPLIYIYIHIFDESVQGVIATELCNVAKCWNDAWGFSHWTWAPLQLLALCWSWPWSSCPVVQFKNSYFQSCRCEAQVCVDGGQKKSLTATTARCPRCKLQRKLTSS